MQAGMRKNPRAKLGATGITDFVESIVGDDMHAKRILSVSNAALGTVQAASLAVNAIGHALAQAQNSNPKHAIKQVDRLLSNRGIDVWNWFRHWVPFVVGARRQVVVAIDWTEFDKDDHATIAIHLLTRHGRATPLMWMTVTKSEMAGKRNAYEDRVLARLRIFLPEGVATTVLGDRGFGDVDLYCLHEELGFDHVIRFRGNIMVTDAKGEARPASEWLHASGRARILHNVTVTNKKIPVPAVVCVWAKGMKEPWFLACGAASSGKTASEVVKLYGRRFTIEESFRDSKNIRFGMGLSATRISLPARRDRVLLLSAIAITLLTLLGAAGENLGMDRMLKANTVRHRTHSLFTQGHYYFGAIPNMSDDRLKPLIEEFSRLLREQPALDQIFGII